MKNKKLQFLLILIVSFILVIAFLWLRGGYVSVLNLTGYPLSILVCGIIYFFFTIFMLKKYKTRLSTFSIIVAIVVGTSLLEAFALIFHNGCERYLISFSDYFMRIFVIFMGLLYCRISNKIGKITLVVVLLLFIGWVSYCGFELWDNSITIK